MLNDLSWLAKGEPFPPTEEIDRLTRYAENKAIYENRHGEVYTEQFDRIKKVIGNTADVISYPVVLNYQKKISLKTADFLFSEPPIFSGDDVIQEIIEDSKLLSLAYQCAIDCSRYGTGVLTIRNVDGKGKIGISKPEHLFAIVDKEDLKQITGYVLAWATKVDDNTKEITAIVHEVGKYSKYRMQYTDGNIGELIEEQENVSTGLNDFAIIPIHNTLTSDTVWGCDDYMDVDSIISELEVRVAQISKVLDVHSAPTVSGSRSALTENDDGTYTFAAGNYYERDSMDDPPLEYLVWDANLEANFKQCENLIKHLTTISEMGAAIFNADMEAGNIPSGSALRKLYINVLAKVTRLRNSFDDGLKKAIALASQIGRKRVDEADISITWQDGLPGDPREDAEIINIRTGGKATMSQATALKQYDGLDDASAEVELEAIRSDDASGNLVGLDVTRDEE